MKAVPVVCALTSDNIPANAETTAGIVNRAVEDVVLELLRAMKKNGPQHSAHEGYAVILEELDELWDEVKLNPSKRSDAELRKEAMQTAAMALRFMIDVTPSV
jgi:hypothetical protein